MEWKKEIVYVWLHFYLKEIDKKQGIFTFKMLKPMLSAQALQVCHSAIKFASDTKKVSFALPTTLTVHPRRLK
jgi:hypothetical protein